MTQHMALAPVFLPFKGTPALESVRIDCSCGWNGWLCSAEIVARKAQERHAQREAAKLPTAADLLTCSRCHLPIVGDFIPAKDAFTGQDVCPDCTRVQRHVRRSA